MPFKDKEKEKAYKKAAYIKDRHKWYWNQIKASYNLSKEDFFTLLENQNNKCALCGKPFQSYASRDLHIDHDHETNKVRGLLCMPCNVGLGMLGDNEEGLIRALKYVRGELN